MFVCLFCFWCFFQVVIFYPFEKSKENLHVCAIYKHVRLLQLKSSHTAVLEASGTAPSSDGNDDGNGRAEAGRTPTAAGRQLAAIRQAQAPSYGREGTGSEGCAWCNTWIRLREREGGRWEACRCPALATQRDAVRISYVAEQNQQRLSWKKNSRFFRTWCELCLRLALPRDTSKLQKALLMQRCSSAPFAQEASARYCRALLRHTASLHHPEVTAPGTTPAVSSGPVTTLLFNPSHYETLHDSSNCAGVAQQLTQPVLDCQNRYCPPYSPPAFYSG